MVIRKSLIVFALSTGVALTGCALEDEERAFEYEVSGAQLGYIVVFNTGTPALERANQMAAEHGLAVSRVYSHALRGFAFNGSERAAQRIAEHRDVAYVEPNGVVALAPPVCPGHPSCGDDGGGSGQELPWGIARVGGPSDGTGKTAWVIDTGIDLDHADLNVDAGRSANFVAKGKNSPDDGNGHGTHVAGTIGAIDNTIDVVGVAANASVVAVRVLDNSGSGTIDGVVAGVDYVAANAASGDVANMSLGATGHFQSLHDAVQGAASGGVKFAIAAGNAGSDAGNDEPAHVEHNNVFTVSAIGQDDCLTSFSNFGSVVDFAAPGAGVLSTKRGGGTTTLSGTSMAAPHVAGLLLIGQVGADGRACNDPDGNADPIAHN